MIGNNRDLILQQNGCCLFRTGSKIKPHTLKHIKSIFGPLYSNQFFALTQNDELYVFGNDLDRFGIITDDNEECSEWRKIKNAPKNIVQIAGSSNFSLFLTASGKLFVVGWSEYGALGLGTDVKQSNKPQQIPTAHRFAQIACGDDFCIAIDKQCKLWSWGRNDFGQCGQGHTENIWAPSLIKSMRTIQISQISTGCGHCLAVTPLSCLSKRGRVLCVIFFASFLLL